MRGGCSRAAVPDDWPAHGPTRVTVEVLDAPGPVVDEWEDIVEASFRPATAKVVLVQWAGEASWTLPLARIDYRVRYIAIGMDRARQRDTVLPGEPLQDRYLLQFWPAPPAPDAVIRETSRAAAYWHSHARTWHAPHSATARRGQRAGACSPERDSRDAALAAASRHWGAGCRTNESGGLTGRSSWPTWTAGSRWDRWPGPGDPAHDRRLGGPAGMRDRRIDLPRLGEAALAALERREPLPFANLADAFRLLERDPKYSWHDRHFLRRPARARFSATHGRAGTLVGRGR